MKRLVADLSLDNEMLQEVLRKNVWSAPPPQARARMADDSTRKCFRPLASGPRLRPDSDEISAPFLQSSYRLEGRF